MGKKNKVYLTKAFKSPMQVIGWVVYGQLVFFPIKCEFSISYPVSKSSNS